MNTVVISSHVLLEGASHALRDYLIAKKVKRILFIALPLIDQIEYSSEIFINGKIKSKKVLKRKISLGPLNYVSDFIWSFYYSAKFEKIDIFIGVDPLNALVGILLKRIGKVKKVIFYGIDFVPIRFESKILNFVFHQIEGLAVRNSDETWNVSSRMKEGREEFLGINSLKYPQKTVPIGVMINKRKHIKNNYQLIFVGHLLEKQGVQRVLDSIPLLVKSNPDFKFLIIGGGEYMEKLVLRTIALGISNNVIFKGWVRDREELEELMLTSEVAVACYKPEKMKLRNFTYYADPTKIKDYLNFGLPVVLTDVPPNAQEIDKNECGIIVQYKKESISKAIQKLLTSKKLINSYKRNASTYISKYSWVKVFDQAFNEKIRN